MALDRSQQATRTAPDHDEIVRHIQLYIDGFNESDATKFKKCFHDDAWIFFTDDEGTLHKWLMREGFDDWAGPEAEKDWVHRILSVTQAGDVASVILEMHSASDPGNAWVDVHALLRIDGAWKDMNKTATHASRADWAGK